MSTVTPSGSATVNPTASQTFPLLPQAWPLTQVPGSDPVIAMAVVPQSNDTANASAVETTIVTTALTQASETGDRLI